MCLYAFYLEKSSVDKPLLEYMGKKFNQHDLTGARSTKSRESEIEIIDVERISGIEKGNRVSRQGNACLLNHVKYQKTRGNLDENFKNNVSN